mmetsp:Transcript_28602/g.67748  ORF Transcript_28602/g.67748 Transcript_28602/m.67748 type:complete len:130 (-) Transcript_28602:463-852(-)
MASSLPDPAEAAKQKLAEIDAIEDRWSVKLAQIKGFVDCGMFTPQQAQEETRRILAQQHGALQEVEDRWRSRGKTGPVQQIQESVVLSQVKEQTPTPMTTLVLNLKLLTAKLMTGLPATPTRILMIRMS